MWHKQRGKNQKKIEIDNTKSEWKTTTTWKGGVCKIQTIRLDSMYVIWTAALLNLRFSASSAQHLAPFTIPPTKVLILFFYFLF